MFSPPAKVKLRANVKSSQVIFLLLPPTVLDNLSYSLSLSLSLSLLPIKLKFKFKLAAHTQTHAGTDTDFGTWQFLTLSPAHALLSPFNQIVKSTSGASHKHGFNVYGRSTSLNLWYSISPMMPKLSLLQNHVWKRLDLFCSCSSWKKKKKASAAAAATLMPPRHFIHFSATKEAPNQDCLKFSLTGAFHFLCGPFCV